MTDTPATGDGDSEPVYQVLSPVSGQRLGPLHPATGLADPATATIAFVWDHLFQGPAIFEVLADRLAAEFPGCRFVGHEAFGDIHGRTESDVVARLPDVLRQHGARAAIVGVGA